MRCAFACGLLLCVSANSYLLNPVSILSCASLSLVVFTNVLLTTTLASGAAGTARCRRCCTVAAVAWSVADMFDCTVAVRIGCVPQDVQSQRVFVGRSWQLWTSATPHNAHSSRQQGQHIPGCLLTETVACSCVRV